MYGSFVTSMPIRSVKDLIDKTKREREIRFQRELLWIAMQRHSEQCGPRPDRAIGA